MTWAQLGLHPKPCALLNIHGYFDSPLLMAQRAVSYGFMRDEYAETLIVHDTIQPILAAFEGYNPHAEIRLRKVLWRKPNQNNK